MSIANIELRADSRQVRTATKDLHNFNSTGVKTDGVQRSMQSAVKNTGVSLDGFSRKAGAAGIQIQQFTGQVTTGTSGLIAMSQQAADLGIVLGAPLAGVLVSLGATALLLGQDADEAASALDRLDEIAETVGNTLERAADGSNIFSESIQRLATRSEALARVQIAQTINDLNDQISTSARGIREAVSELDGARLDVGIVDTVQALGLQLEDIPRLFGDISSEVDTLGAGGLLTVRGLTERIDLLATSLGISREQAVDLQVAIDDFANNQNATGIATLRSEIEDLTTEVGADNEKVVQLASNLTAFFESSREGVDRINLLREALSDLNGTLEANSDSTDKTSNKSRNYTSSLQAQIIAMTSGAEAAELFAAGQSAIANGTEALLPAQIKLIQAKYDLREAQEAAAEAAELEIEQQKNYGAVLDEIFKKEELRSKQAAAREAARMARLQNVAAGNLGLTDLQALEQQYEAERSLLEQAQEEGIHSKISYEDRLTQLQQEYSDRRKQIMSEEQAASFNILSDGTTASLNAFGQTLGNLANIAAQGGEETFQTYKNLASAQAAISATMSVLAVLGDPSIPTVARVPLAFSIGALAAANVAMIQSQEYQGARRQGGQVLGGNSYLVGEAGPEVVTMGGRANVTPFNQLMQNSQGKSETNVQVNVTNNASNSDVTTEERQDAQGNRVIDIVVNNINQRGKIHRAMTQTTTAGNRI